jgi:hypothetical protein
LGDWAAEKLRGFNPGYTWRSEADITRVKNDSKELVRKNAFEKKYENENNIVVGECYVVSIVVLVPGSC